MKKLLQPSRIILIVGFLTLILFLSWYRGSQAPLSPDELAHYSDRLHQLPDSALEFIDTEDVTNFLQADDGKPFYVVNVFQFSENGGNSFSKFTQQIIPLWLKHGSHPVFSSSLDQTLDSEWDFISVVKYRSRRDFAEIQTSEKYIEALADRLSATQKNLRIKVSGNVFPVMAILLAMVMLLLILLLACLSAKFKKHSI